MSFFFLFLALLRLTAFSPIFAIIFWSSHASFGFSSLSTVSALLGARQFPKFLATEFHNEQERALARSLDNTNLVNVRNTMKLLLEEQHLTDPVKIATGYPFPELANDASLDLRFALKQAITRAATALDGALLSLSLPNQANPAVTHDALQKRTHVLT